MSGLRELHDHGSLDHDDDRHPNRLLGPDLGASLHRPGPAPDLRSIAIPRSEPVATKRSFADRGQSPRPKTGTDDPSFRAILNMQQIECSSASLIPQSNLTDDLSNGFENLPLLCVLLLHICVF